MIIAFSFSVVLYHDEGERHSEERVYGGGSGFNRSSKGYYLLVRICFKRKPVSGIFTSINDDANKNVAKAKLVQIPQESEKLLACVQENVENLTAMVDKFFEGGEEVYRYVSK